MDRKRSIAVKLKEKARRNERLKKEFISQSSLHEEYEIRREEAAMKRVRENLLAEDVM